MPIAPGLATGIGSLPYHDAEQAVDLIMTYLPQIPFWPQLPKRDIREGMLTQFSEQLPCLQLTEEGLQFVPQDQDRALEHFYSHVIDDDVDYFKISPDYAAGVPAFIRRLEKTNLDAVHALKGQITGPFTFGASITNEEKTALLHDPVMMQAIIKGLVMKAKWQIALLRKFGKKIIVFIDEPYLGCFGSAFTPLNKEEVVRGLSELCEGFASLDVLIGAHCCGNTDWSLFTDVPGIDIINFDAYGFLDKFTLYAPQIQQFLQRGGRICWGIVPTQLAENPVSARYLIEQLHQGIAILAKKGVDQHLLKQNLMVSPSCGLGTLSEDQAATILKALQEVSRLQG
ncbi:MAG: hypothetical protein KBA46_01680 [Candidatus Omnitrophica bacterium]|nr:hypothetical protein [Candidatus Omnitrophota bacterium]